MAYEVPVVNLLKMVKLLTDQLELTLQPLGEELSIIFNINFIHLFYTKICYLQMVFLIGLGPHSWQTVHSSGKGIGKASP